MITVKKILVPIDFGEISNRVLDFGRMLADACGASLHLLHVIGYSLGTRESEGQERGDACKRLEALLDRVDRESRRATVSCQVGTPAVEIVHHATDHAIDFIVMGTHSHGPTFQMVVGSVAENVIREAPCAVLAVKNIEAARQATDFDPVSTATNPSGAAGP